VDCGGDYTLTKGIKDCSECLFPHIPENYDKVVDFLKRKLKPN
jgi:Zn-finger protein